MNTPNDLRSPIFTPRPGWGGRFKAWTRDNGSRTLAILAILAVGTAIVVDQVRDDNDEVAKVSPSPSATPKGSVASENTQRYEYQARPGQGVTHLARVAVTEYLQDTPDTKLVAEQRVFAEDFLKDRTLANRIKSSFLEINEAIAFEVTDIKAAVNAALTLTAEQIAALSRFVRMIVGF